MRKLFHTAAVAALLAFSMAANAAEVGARPPVYAPPPIYMAPPFSWTGFYLGANIGGAWGRRNVTDQVHHQQYGDGRIDHRLQHQHQQRLAGRRGHRMGVRAQLVGEDRV
jgi:hypothetical protein